MLPPRHDERWQGFLQKMSTLPFTGISTQILVSRLKIKMILDDSAESRKEAVDDAYSFFVSNQQMVGDDIALIFP